ncbi:MAG: HlyD family efflux transporter periplasmic adaptor subunit [Acetobacteraceae bacterium]|nr:HlyD family efflux transporter periplasmic adaptor subunit [Acetobacteraceae bacterium]
MAAALLVVSVGGGLWWWRQHKAAELPAWQGYVEADFVKVGPTLAGVLTSVGVARGDPVQVGTPLFAQDDVAERAARDQAARQLDQARQQLANLESGGKETEIQQAEANLADMRATLARTAADLERSQTLLRSGFATKQNVDQLVAEHQSAEAKVAAGEAALAQLRAPLGRAAEIKAQTAAVEAAGAALQMAEWRLAQRDTVAPMAGRVADVLARPGEMMSAGAPVISLLPPGNIFVRFFVPEPALSDIHRGDSVGLTCDGCRPDLRATISFIAPQAEYTPPVIYSEESRSKLVFLVEARPPPDQAPLFNPGQPLRVRLLPRSAVQ